MNAFLADLIVAIHVGYVAFVVVGQLAIWVGWALGHRWVRNFWFRITHLLAIAIVVGEELLDIRCPLTVWEEYFRERAGQPTSGATFLGRLLHSLIFYDFPPWVFTTIYLTTLAVVLATLILCRPRHPFRPYPAAHLSRPYPDAHPFRTQPVADPRAHAAQGPPSNLTANPPPQGRSCVG